MTCRDEKERDGMSVVVGASWRGGRVGSRGERVRGDGWMGWWMSDQLVMDGNDRRRLQSDG